MARNNEIVITSTSDQTSDHDHDARMHDIVLQHSRPAAAEPSAERGRGGFVSFEDARALGTSTMTSTARPSHANNTIAGRIMPFTLKMPRSQGRYAGAGANPGVLSQSRSKTWLIQPAILFLAWGGGKNSYVD